MKALLLLTLVLCLLAVPCAVEAQPLGSVPTIGVLSIGSPPSEDTRQRFWQAMRTLGWVEGQNIAVERRYAEGDDARLPTFAAELVQRPVDVLLADGTPAVLAAKHATSTIPIIMTGSGDPVGLGLIERLARPGVSFSEVAFISHVVFPPC
jgi:putative ABC transport system substrate-binding protein